MILTVQRPLNLLQFFLPIGEKLIYQTQFSQRLFK